MSEPSPFLFWDSTLEVYGFEDGDEQGVCQHSSTTDALDLISLGSVPTALQLHRLSDDWGFREIVFVDKLGRRHLIPAAEDCRELGPTNAEVEAIQNRALGGPDVIR